MNRSNVKSDDSESPHVALFLLQHWRLIINSIQLELYISKLSSYCCQLSYHLIIQFCCCCCCYFNDFYYLKFCKEKKKQRLCDVLSFLLFIFFNM
ncbi:hypothetical protein DICVIV_01929 [Dictyocaulus viviparus]|uniref:Uncharacterized protein n=1 Tax=Dictyocaulus viviparus TaxID=29172 RepID=A0A0D8Y553_DICVI|nr:hypothetical protein DICVIV_01929 [Dictyocaulus viviparus]